MAKLSIVIPCYFNEQNIPITMQRLIANEASFPAGTVFEYIFVDDGSKDNTYAELKKIKNIYPESVKLVKLSRNFGAHNASLAGLGYATGQANVILAADMQDPPELLPQMFAYWQQGFPLVMANREDRDEPFIQKWVSNSFHWLMRKTALPHAPKGGVDLVLFDSSLREIVVQRQEKRTHIIYLIISLTDTYFSIPYIRQKREIGISRWTLSKKIISFTDSIFRFSTLPNTIVIMCIFLLLIFSFLFILNLISFNIFLISVLLFFIIKFYIAFIYITRIHDIFINSPGFVVERTEL